MILKKCYANKTIVIVESPFQLLNSLEYLNKKSILFSHVKFYLINSINSVNRNQLEKTAILFSLDFRLINLYSKIKLKSQVLFFLELINFRLFKENREIEKVVFGNSRSSVSVGLVNCLSCKNITLVDDGTSSLKLIDSLNNNNNNNTGLKSVLKKILNLNIQEVQFKEFFTSYDDIDCSKINFSIIKNEGFLLKEKFKKIEKLNKIFFIGTPLIELGIVDENVFLNLIKSISNLHKIRKNNVVYFPHRREDKKNILAIEKITKWEINKDLDFPFELSLLQKGIPIEISGFFTSVLNNMKTYNVETKLSSYVIPNNYFLKNNLFYKNIYNNYKKLSITLISDFIDND